jgi:hypothetical protein
MIKAEWYLEVREKEREAGMKEVKCIRAENKREPTIP